MATNVESRLSNIERIMEQLAFAQLRNEEAIFQSTKDTDELKVQMTDFKDEMSAFKNEMSEFKNGMTDFKDEMSAFKDEMTDFKDEMSAFKDEMSDFKNEMSEFKNEMRREMVDYKEEGLRITRDLNRKWGELANRLGTIVEDIVLPNMPGIMREHFGVEEPEFIAVRVQRTHPHDRSRRREFDLIAVSSDRLFLNETKSNVKVEYMRAFDESKEEVFEYFPEYRNKTLVPIFSTLYFSDAEIAYLSKRGIYAAMLSDDAMDIVNHDDIAGNANAGSPE